MFIDVDYETKPKILESVIKAIKEADLIILSMGSLYTSILPNLICEEVKNAIDESNAEVMYICNIVTQPGETDNFKASDHIKVLNKYLGKKKVSSVIVNNGTISKEVLETYSTKEQKDIVIFDKENLEKIPVKILDDDLVIIENGTLRHNNLKLALKIYSYLISEN